jgi:hypothetical protein
MCDVKRIFKSIAPVANRHEMRSFECPKCHSVFRLVVALPEPSAAFRRRHKVS